MLLNVVMETFQHISSIGFHCLSFIYELHDCGCCCRWVYGVILWSQRTLPMPSIWEMHSLNYLRYYLIM